MPLNYYNLGKWRNSPGSISGILFLAVCLAKCHVNLRLGTPNSGGGGHSHVTPCQVACCNCPNCGNIACIKPMTYSLLPSTFCTYCRHNILYADITYAKVHLHGHTHTQRDALMYADAHVKHKWLKQCWIPNKPGQQIVESGMTETSHNSLYCLY